ncbi:hypothetical protein GCM10027046_37330 [Uliginosibacterium flavum]|uniref:Uncharacterized protein n=1 Tax=Uliginosibacterium flavum TaxID=1396831 RepID=A0ABV2TM14_9RHOO
MSTLLRRACCLLVLLAPTLLPLPASAGPQDVPELLPLQAVDFPPECGCIYGTKKGVPLIFWSWENDKQNAVIREASGAKKLTLRSEKYFPAQHEPARAGDRMTLQLSNSDWSVQTVSEVTASCSPKAKTCKGTTYRSRMILQWQGRHRTELQGWGHCGCS